MRKLPKCWLAGCHPQSGSMPWTNTHTRTHQLVTPFLAAYAREDLSTNARKIFLDIKARDTMEGKALTQAVVVDRMFIGPSCARFVASTANVLGRGRTDGPRCSYRAFTPSRVHSNSKAGHIMRRLHCSHLNKQPGFHSPSRTCEPFD